MPCSKTLLRGIFRFSDLNINRLSALYEGLRSRWNRGWEILRYKPFALYLVLQFCGETL